MANEITVNLPSITYQRGTVPADLAGQEPVVEKQRMSNFSRNADDEQPPIRMRSTPFTL